MTTHVTRERVLAQLRRVVNRLARSLPKKRTGYFFIWSRFLLERFEQFTRPARPAGGVEEVRLERVVGAGDGAYTELESPTDDVEAHPVGCRVQVLRRRANPCARCRKAKESWRFLEALSSADEGSSVRTAPVCWRTQARCGPATPQYCSRTADEALAVGLEELDGVSMSTVDRSVELRPLPPAERAAPGSRWSTWSAAQSRSRPRCSRAPRSSSPRTVPRSRISCSRVGTVAIELMGTNTVSDIYVFSCWRRGLDYQMIPGTEPALPPRWWTWQIDADTVVDVPALERALRRVGC